MRESPWPSPLLFAPYVYRMTVHQYVENLNRRYKLGNATEHTFRGDLQLLIESLLPGVRATNEPKRQSCGAPDYILTRAEIPVGYIEAKDIGDKDLQGAKKTGNKEQFDRYKASLDNLLFTDYLDFHLYHNGGFVTSVAVAEKVGESIVPLQQNFAAFTNLVKDFTTRHTQTIKSPKRLAEMMAGKARLLSDVIAKALTGDAAREENSTLKEQMEAFRQILIHDITAKGFADVYAQTIAYGLFAARLHDPTLPTFSRQEAAELIPRSNPFLRKLFGYIAGPDIDDRIRWIVDGLAEIFLACNVEELLKNYGKSTQTEDPIIHFYETFLSEYDPALRKARGVWYTPQPVVNFIVRAVDDVLKTEFGLPQGLADTSKTKVKVALQQTDKRYANNVKTVEEEVHRVQILDPATGTGTFLAEAVKRIHSRFAGQQGIWSAYVENHLLPRLNGFELLMASYAMAHLKLDLLLTETGYKPTGSKRLKIYLTNSLEESHPDTGTLFASWLSTEANEANRVKRDTPVMCVIGNPPYSGESANKGEWITRLMEDYKKEPGGKEKLKEKNSKWINDDYVKFLRYGQHFIEKNGSGVLAFINPHGYLDNPTFRGMRWNLLKTYDKIYTIDLHGNSKKKETASDGSVDENVFDIQQGVSINIFIKTGLKKPNELGSVFHHDLYGKREMKYSYLVDKKLTEISFKEVKATGPDFLFLQSNHLLQVQYDKGFLLNKLFVLNGNGIVSKRDAIAFSDDKNNIKTVIRDLSVLSGDEVKSKYHNVSWDSRDGKVEFVQQNVQEFGQDERYFIECDYRPFDKKWTYYTGKAKGFIGWPVKQVMEHFIIGDNLGLNLVRRSRSGEAVLPFLTQHIVDKCILSTLDNANLFPLYVYSNGTQQTFLEHEQRHPNLAKDVVTHFMDSLNLTFTPEKEATPGTFAPIHILDYIYAVLHSPTYREKYKEFLKIDFPRVPYPINQKMFWDLVALGGELRQLHLLESPAVESYITQYPVDGTNEVTGPPKYVPRPKNTETEALQGDVYINDTQFFQNVPLTAWKAFIGGYQPAQKWLKDRRGRTLLFEDIGHYQKMIVALSETHRLMQAVDAVEGLPF